MINVDFVKYKGSVLTLVTLLLLVILK